MLFGVISDGVLFPVLNSLQSTEFVDIRNLLCECSTLAVFSCWVGLISKIAAQLVTVQQNLAPDPILRAKCHIAAHAAFR